MKQMRFEQELTQEMLAKKCNMNYSSIIRIECRQAKNPTLKMLVQIANGLEIPFHEFFKNLR